MDLGLIASKARRELELGGNQWLKRTFLMGSGARVLGVDWRVAYQDFGCYQDNMLHDLAKAAMTHLSEANMRWLGT